MRFQNKPSETKKVNNDQISRKTLKTNVSQQKINTKTVLRQKRKLLVYKKDGKFFIDNSAAYALKLKNVRAIMTGKTRLIEIGIETLYRFQNNEDIEIEYQDFNKDKNIKREKSDLIETLTGLEEGEYGIGIHGIDRGNIEEKQGLADIISDEGLKINNNSKTILSTSISLGTNEDVQRISREISEYKFGNGAKVSIIIAVPLYIQNKDEEKIFLGFPDKNKKTSGQQYEEHCILDRICSKMKIIPPQFILGYYLENPDGTNCFIRNELHYSNLSLEDRESFFTELASNMDDVLKSYNEMITNGNIEKLEQIKISIQKKGFNVSFINNLLTLAKKYKNQSHQQDIGKKNTRRIIINSKEKSNGSSNSQRKNVRRVILDSNLPKKESPDLPKWESTRKILLDACKETKNSDLVKAEELLLEGREEQKEQEGREE